MPKPIHPLYHVWTGMNQRCYNAKSDSYYLYGARGITVCDRWRHSFANFIEDMGERPAGFVLDKRDNDKEYGPENCRWVNKTTSAINTRNRVNTSSEYRGVCEIKSGGWVASIKYKNIRYNVGFSLDEEQAALMYDAAAIQLHGDDAQTNLIGRG